MSTTDRLMPVPVYCADPEPHEPHDFLLGNLRQCQCPGRTERKK